MQIAENHIFSSGKSSAASPITILSDLACQYNFTLTNQACLYDSLIGLLATVEFVLKAHVGNTSTMLITLTRIDSDLGPRVLSN